jgi:hypothetical protein
MKAFMGTAAIALLLALGVQTYESARFHKAAIVCHPDDTSTSDCIGLGPVGGVRKSGIRLVGRIFVRSGRELPSRIRESIRNHAAKYHL